MRNADKRFRSFEEAREFVRSLGLQDYEEWCEYRKSEDRPLDIPTAPNTAYRDINGVDTATGLVRAGSQPKTGSTGPSKKHVSLCAPWGSRTLRSGTGIARLARSPTTYPQAPTTSTRHSRMAPCQHYVDLAWFLLATALSKAQRSDIF